MLESRNTERGKKALPDKQSHEPSATETFKVRLKSLMASREGETLATVAEACGCSPQAVHKWLNGGDIGYSYLRKLASRYGVNWVWLRYGDEAAERQERREQTGFNLERRRQIDNIVRSESLHRSALRQAGIGVWQLDTCHMKFEWAESSRELLGIDEEYPNDLLDFLQLLVDEDQPEVQEKLTEAIEATGRAEFEFRLKAEPERPIIFICGFEAAQLANFTSLFGVLFYAEVLYRALRLPRRT